MANRSKGAERFDVFYFCLFQIQIWTFLHASPPTYLWCFEGPHSYRDELWQGFHQTSEGCGCVCLTELASRLENICTTSHRAAMIICSHLHHHSCCPPPIHAHSIPVWPPGYRFYRQPWGVGHQFSCQCKRDSLPLRGKVEKISYFGFSSYSYSGVRWIVLVASCHCPRADGRRRVTTLIQ